MIELLVVVTIFGFISAVVLAKYPSFNQKMSVSNIAHQIALEIRQAQVYGASGKGIVTLGGSVTGYGIYFSRDIPTSFVLYADVNGNRKYDHTGDGSNCSANSECLESVSISSGDDIKDFCATLSGVTKCATASQIDYVNIIFIRPDPEANIIGTLSGVDTTYENFQATIESPKKDFSKTIWVWSTGQVSIQD